MAKIIKILILAPNSLIIKKEQHNKHCSFGYN
ncbi:hypothetical protein Q787_09330 [Ornithobacterium rhinotracheale H06-030791]|nr:hypothetical protein Q785_09515 [Ornithobacterium rhinotracheale ORT-UMN 88]KGB66292.1 hypothetical protein Q787_09330 [Ornithobacterium rhinotracheale H06-030791]